MAEKDWIRQYFAPLAKAPGAAGLTDDTAEISKGYGPLIATVDAMVEGVHFFADDPVETIARKLVRVNVSDILGSGAVPREALLTLGWPQAGRNPGQIGTFADSFGTELDRWGILLAGGDTVMTPGGLFLSLTLTGECLGPAPVRRGGGKAGDDVWVTGEIGAARRGYLWKTQGLGEAGWLNALQVPELPPLEAAGLISAHASAAMDISDGLLGDLSSLAAASGLGAQIDLDQVPFAGGAASLEEMIDLSSWGDDYQLLFAAPPQAAGFIQDFGLRVTRIGRLAEGAGLVASHCGKPVNLPETLAFEHGRVGGPAARS
ncbi:thiamine-monophosphate kinase [Hyphomonas neptunium ATCC 15444]|uniref:Thiamine-monophosphate kinase n=2 Tax=Hyphomonas TaxID=85 RepID=Q0C317_HYPNA|nr:MULTISPECIES: thiamine-phosphate kinase [Hyphomonas]ABI76342.1 thiamine-monophosphate kinase [Hyphomonas neptunium ATCC 15444]KCZ95887.1 thiamine-monophosphate kinase [Hyphomonas hirschiana VP5]